MKITGLKKWISLLLAAVLCLSASGCSMSEVTTDELMRPPQLSQSRQQVQTAINKLLGGAQTLVAPSGGEHRSSINLADLNGDGQNEAICFCVNAQSKQIEVIVLQKKEDSWQQRGKFASDATAVERLEITDLNGDGLSELIIGWSYLAGSERTLQVLRLSDNALFSLYNNRCSQYQLIEKPSPRIISIDLSGHAASLLGYKGHKFASLSSVPIDPRIMNFTAVTTAKTTLGQPAVYLDAQLEDQSYHTEILVIAEEEYLENKLFTDGGGVHRALNIRCADIDADGLPEVPQCAAMEQGEGAGYYTYWSKFDGKQLLEPLTTFTAPTDSFYFVYPEHWIEKVFVRQDSTLQRLYHFVTPSGQALYSLRLFTPTEFSEIHPSEGWILLSESADKVIAYKKDEFADKRPFSKEAWAAAVHTY